jgi:hypothetical protein
VTEIFDWLEKSAWASEIRQSLWMYPTLEIIHILGIVLLVGAALLFDLCLLGFSKNLSVNDLSRYLLPWSRRGLILVIPSGVLLFITNASSLSADSIFWVKVILIGVAGLNAFAFHRFTKAQENLDNSINPPLHYKVQALISAIVWTAVIAFGRLLAY